MRQNQRIIRRHACDPPFAGKSQNLYVERLIGTLRRECLDHVVIFGERHLHRVLTLYPLYYNETHTHLGLAKDAPIRRAVQRSGSIVTTPVLSGLDHSYARIYFQEEQPAVVEIGIGDQWLRSSCTLWRSTSTGVWDRRSRGWRASSGTVNG
jgi:hypothetical protein